MNRALKVINSLKSSHFSHSPQNQLQSHLIYASEWLFLAFERLSHELFMFATIFRFIISHMHDDAFI